MYFREGFLPAVTCLGAAAMMQNLNSSVNPEGFLAICKHPTKYSKFAENFHIFCIGMLVSFSVVLVLRIAGLNNNKSSRFQDARRVMMASCAGLLIQLMSSISDYRNPYACINTFGYNVSLYMGHELLICDSPIEYPCVCV